MRRIQQTVFAVVIALAPTIALAQTAPRGDVTASLGADRVFRVEDRAFGTVASPGVGVEFRLLPRIGVGFDFHRAVGFDTFDLVCAPPAGVPCSGSAREGVTMAATSSVTAAWYGTSDPRIQPYVLGGLSVVRSRSVNALTMARPELWTVTEREDEDTGLGPTAGVGVRFLVANRFVVKPEWRLSSGTALGRANLSVMRTTVAAGYAF